MAALASLSLLLVLFSLPPVLALPLHNPILSPPPFQPLPFILALLPLPILAAIKYSYLRFRRGQSIHTLPHSPRPSSFSLALTPYLVGLFGSPHWETTISCRIHASSSLSPPNPRSIPLSLHSHFLHSDKSTTITSTLVSSFSRRSPSIPCPVSRSSFPHPSFSASLFPLPSSPLAPPSIHITSSLSPTLMQIMAPVLNSSYDQASATLTLPCPSLRPTDPSNRFSTSTTHSSLLFRTSLNPSPAQIFPLILLPKQLPPSPPSSAHSISPSPASLSLAIFHSPLASRVPVPKPVYTPSLRPESCVVLPRDWPSSQEPALPDSVLPDPVHSFPPSRSPTVSSPLSHAIDLSRLPVRPLTIFKSPGKLGHCPFPPIDDALVYPRSPQAISHLPTNRTPSPALSFPRSSQYQDWELADLHDLDGRLDVDAISRALGLGLGLGLPVAASISNHDLETSEHASSSHSGSVVSSESEDAGDFDPPLDEQSSECHLKHSGWDHREGDLATFLGISLQMHVHGQPLSAIPEETSSEIGSSVDEDDDNLSGGPDISAADSYDEKVDLESTISNARSASIIWDGSWREGESIARLSVGVAC